MKLSILVPGIRTMKWKDLYDSVQLKCEWEMIIISPYALPANVKNHKNIVHIQDWGSPIRCQQRGLMAAKGEYITWAADDGQYRGAALDNAIKVLNGKENCLVMGKYMEGRFNPDMTKDAYYILNNHNATSKLNKKYWMLNCGVVPRKMLLDFDGWDCRFEVCPMSYNDLAIRLQNADVEFIIQGGLMFECTHTPCREGDHAPIHDAQTEHDEPLFRKIWKDMGRSTDRLVTWEESPEKWTRRFK